MVDTPDPLKTHPCYNEEAHKKFARMHLPVAPRCNIQCNYCNRKYDCSNESRPGVTSEILTPQEAADKVAFVLEKIPELSVIGIAGPGDPLANEETFETIRLVRERFPDLTLCISTNGLTLPENAQRLFDLGVRFLTVTMNAVDPTIGERIYSFVTVNGKRVKGRKAAEFLLERQLEGIRKCVELGMFVKINSVLIPGVNDEHLPDVIKAAERLNVYMVNVLPLIPVAGTPFENLRAPTPEERKRIADLGSGKVKMMRHCRQCRADAIGLLDNDRSGEFVRTKTACGSGCGPSRIPQRIGGMRKIAVATNDGINVNMGFGHTGTFVIYDMCNSIEKIGDVSVERAGSVYGEEHDRHLSDLILKMSEYDIIIVKEIGPRPLAELSRMGKTVVVSDGTIDEAISRLEE